MKEDRSDFNACKYCNRKLTGLSVCECEERIKNHKLWNKNPKNGDKSKKVSLNRG